jgi:ADP-ribose pyrophosphatase YjhB (NUDIX family)
MQIREHFAFCPKCGAPAEESAIHRRFTCEKCAFQVYFNVGASVSGICRRSNGDVLLLKRMHPPREGTWTLPGGFAEPGESGTDALMREIKEETGLIAINPVPHSAFPNLYIYRDVTYATFDMVYVCGLEGSPMLDGIEVDAHRWFSTTELTDVDISFPSLRSALILYVSQHNHSRSSG